MYDKKLILNLGFTELLAGFDDFAATLKKRGALWSFLVIYLEA